jgi:hypothetical protein
MTPVAKIWVLVALATVAVGGPFALMLAQYRHLFF